MLKIEKKTLSSAYTEIKGLKKTEHDREVKSISLSHFINIYRKHQNQLGNNWNSEMGMPHSFAKIIIFI